MFSVDMGIDLGTCNTLVCVKGEGIVLNEPSVVAVRRGTNQVLRNGNAVGQVAKEMLGRTPGSISAIRPLKDGVIADFDITEAMLGYFIRKVHGRSRFVKPRVVVAVPSGITAVEKRAVYNSAERAGARRVYLVEEPMAAGIGAGLPIGEATASMIVDIGGGTTDVAVISMAGIVYSSSVRVAGNEMDEAVIKYLRKKYNLLIGERTAEQVKIEIGSAYPLDKPMTMESKGRNLIEGIPKPLVVADEEIREALEETLAVIINAVRVALERTPPELSADIVDRGIMLVGGGSLLRDFDHVLRQETKLPILRSDDPFTAVVHGAGNALDNLSLLKDVALN